LYARRGALPAGGRVEDSVWEQKKLEARKLPSDACIANAADSHTSGARGVGRNYGFNLRIRDK